MGKEVLQWQEEAELFQHQVDFYKNIQKIKSKNLIKIMGCMGDKG